MMLGAICDTSEGGDHIGVQMTFKDTLRYYGDDPEKMGLLSIAMGGGRKAEKKQKQAAAAEQKKPPRLKRRKER